MRSRARLNAADSVCRSWPPSIMGCIAYTQQACERAACCSACMPNWSYLGASGRRPPQPLGLLPHDRWRETGMLSADRRSVAGRAEHSTWLTPWLAWRGLTSNSLTMLGWSSFFITAISRTMSLGRLGVQDACSHSTHGSAQSSSSSQGHVTAAAVGVTGPYQNYSRDAAPHMTTPAGEEGACACSTGSLT